MLYPVPNHSPILMIVLGNPSFAGLPTMEEEEIRKTGILQKLCTDAHSYIVESITRLYFQNEFQINHMQI